MANIEDGTVERRKHPRYKTKEGAVALHAGNVGRINNISLGGVSCSCTFVDSTACDKNTHLDIFFSHSDNPIHLQDIPVSIASAEMSLGSVFSCLFSRRCGIQFGELTESQEDLLKEFIAHYTET